MRSVTEKYALQSTFESRTVEVDDQTLSDSRQAELCLKASTVGRLQHPWTERAVHVNCATNHIVNKWVADESHDAGPLQGRDRSLRPSPERNLFFSSSTDRKRKCFCFMAL